MTNYSGISRREALGYTGGLLLLSNFLNKGAEASNTNVQANNSNITFNAGGWNLFGVTEEVSVADLQDSNINIREFNGKYFWRFEDGQWQNPARILPGEGCYVLIGSNASTKSGNQAKYIMNTVVPSPFQMNSGWNMVSSSNKTGTSELELSGVRDSLSEYQGELFWTLIKSSWETSNQMSPGRGYWVYSEDDVLFVPTDWYQDIGNQILSLKQPFTVDAYEEMQELSNQLNDRASTLIWDVLTPTIIGGGGVSDLVSIIGDTASAFSVAASAAETLSVTTYRQKWAEQASIYEDEYDELEGDFSDSSFGVPERPVEALFEAVIKPFSKVALASSSKARRSAIEDTLSQISAVTAITGNVPPIESTAFDYQETKDALNKSVKLYHNILDTLAGVLEQNLENY